MGKVEKIEGVKRADRSPASLAEKELRVCAYCRVSTDLEDQKNSYESQMLYYGNYIRQHKNWQFAGLYSDEAITGTKTDKRFGFQKMIADAESGMIDLIICKSISRFARNTVDTLQYVRRLKEIGVEVWFEEENIRTLTMDGELLLTILSSVAQQEVTNISEHVRAGMLHKMAEGVPVGFSECLGYRYDARKKEFTIVESEAEIVRLIFDLYLRGWGTTMIRRELNQRGCRTKRNVGEWNESTIIGILKNEKYVGDLLMGKTTSLDPISKKRVRNNGHSDKFLVRDDHEAIISREDFEAVQKEIARRAKLHMTDEKGRKSRLSTVTPFSSKIRCGFCGAMVNRRSVHSGSAFKKVVWMCSDKVFRGKEACPDSKMVHEEMIEKAFVQCFNHMITNKSVVISDLMKKVETALANSDAEDLLKENKRRQRALEEKNSNLIDLLLEKRIEESEYNQKHSDNLNKLRALQEEEKSLVEMKNIRSECMKRINSFQKLLERKEPMAEFDPMIFNELVENVIIGGYTNGKPDPFKLLFVFKTGLSSSTDSSQFRTDKRFKKTVNKIEQNKPVVMISGNKSQNSTVDGSKPVMYSGATDNSEVMDYLTGKKTIVLLVISVLFLLTVPNIQKTMEIVNNKGCKAIEKVADAAILQYRMQYDEYPGSTGDLISAGLLTEDQATCDGNKSLVISGGQAYIE